MATTTITKRDGSQVEINKALEYYDARTDSVRPLAKSTRELIEQLADRIDQAEVRIAALENAGKV